jgi:5-formyltetrahydrofolate cyclo-ligase
MKTEKDILRRSVRKQVSQVPSSLRFERSARATQILLSRPEWQDATAIMAFLPLSDELDLRPALEAALAESKSVMLPCFSPKEACYRAAQITSFLDLIPGNFGILEPHPDSPAFPLKRLDFVLVPGVAFAPNGHRLGRGKGFYDRLLANVTSVKCGVAQDEQIVPILPAEPHDIAMDFILTPTRWLKTQSDGNK